MSDNKKAWHVLGDCEACGAIVFSDDDCQRFDDGIVICAHCTSEDRRRMLSSWRRSSLESLCVELIDALIKERQKPEGDVRNSPQLTTKYGVPIPTEENGNPLPDNPAKYIRDLQD